MKKKLVRVANQIYILETKLQNGENVQENVEKMEKLIKSISESDWWEVNKYLEDKIKKHPI